MFRCEGLRLVPALGFSWGEVRFGVLTEGSREVFPILRCVT